MKAGAQYFDESGALIFDLTDMVGRVLGAVETGLVAGSLTEPGFATGRPFYIFRGYNVPNQNGVAALSIAISGNTLVWTAGTTPSVQNFDGLIIYGVY